jgi:hypothetical protein
MLQRKSVHFGLFDLSKILFEVALCPIAEIAFGVPLTFMLVHLQNVFALDLGTALQLTTNLTVKKQANLVSKIA